VDLVQHRGEVLVIDGASPRLVEVVEEVGDHVHVVAEHQVVEEDLVLAPEADQVVHVQFLKVGDKRKERGWFSESSTLWNPKREGPESKHKNSQSGGTVGTTMTRGGRECWRLTNLARQVMVSTVWNWFRCKRKNPYLSSFLQSPVVNTRP
jgi:hypothetical protein